VKFSTFFEKKDPLDTPQEEIPVRFLSFHFSKRPFCHFLRLKNYQILSLKKYQCCKFEIFKNEKITIYPRKPKNSFLVLKGLRGVDSILRDNFVWVSGKAFDLGSR